MIIRLIDLSKIIIDKLQKNTIMNYIVILYSSFMICPPPYFVSYVPSYIKTPLRLLGIFFILFIYFFFVIYKRRISKLFVSVFVMCLYFLIICLVNHNDYFYALYSNFFMTLSGIALFEIYTNSNLKKEFIKINYYFWLVSIIVFIIVLITGYDNLAHMYNRNNYIMFIIIYLLFERAMLMMEDNMMYRLISYIMSVVLIVFSIVIGSATTVSVLIIINSYVYIFDRVDLYKRKFDNFFLYAIALVLFFFLFIAPGSKSPIIDFVSALFHKQSGFSGRNVWNDVAREVILKRPIFGYGSMQEYYSLLGEEYVRPHNFVFQYLIDGGLIGLILLFNCYRIIINSIKRKTNIDLRNYLFIVLFAFTLRNLMEALGLNYLFYVLGHIYFFCSTTSEDYYTIQM